MNWEEVRTHWEDVSKHFHHKWVRLTEADLKAIGGQRDELVKRLQARYGLTKHAAEAQAESFVEALQKA
jgi:uncharacterized protein YjbJ (UPF0337 family)